MCYYPERGIAHAESDGETTITTVERVFAEHDKTGGGFIMLSELPSLLTALGPVLFAHRSPCRLPGARLEEY